MYLNGNYGKPKWTKVVENFSVESRIIFSSPVFFTWPRIISSRRVFFFTSRDFLQ